MNQGQDSRGTQEDRRRSDGWDKVPVALLRPVGERTMAVVVHVAALRLVWQRREFISVGYDQEMH